MKYIIDHDLHCHTHLSLCSGDPMMTPQTILKHAQELNYRFQALTDHYWDEALKPCDDPWYVEQNTAHIKQDFPMPEDTGNVKLLFGCETEIDSRGVVGVSKEKLDDYGFIVIPPNHLHLRLMTNPGVEHTPENLARMFTERLELLTRLDLPWHKIGIAHLNFMTDDDLSVQAVMMMDRDRLMKVFKAYAKMGVGIELNSECFHEGDTHWLENEESHMRLFYMAREAGCKFYCGSDYHLYSHMYAPEYSMETCLRPVLDRLELTEDDKFIPETK